MTTPIDSSKSFAKERFQTYVSWKNYISHLLKCEECWNKHREILKHIEEESK